MNKRKLICLLCALFLAASAAGTAAAEERVVVWKVKETKINTEALLDRTFDRKDGGPYGEIRKETRDRGTLFWELQDHNSVPFCGTGPVYDKSAGIQNQFDIFRRRDDDSQYTYYYHLDSSNTLPEESGFRAERAAETCEQAGSLLEELGLATEHVAIHPVSFSTLGRINGTTKCRKAVFEELLDGLPVRWSAQDLDEENYRKFIAAECYAEAAFSDEEGLLYTQGAWCDFEPVKRSFAWLSAGEAAQRFAAAGRDGAEPEACWFLCWDGKNAYATLAWREGNMFLSAADGNWLQTE